MPVSNAYDGNTPTVNADADTWGGELNTALGQIDTTLDAYATAINTNTTVSAAALPKAGGTMTGDAVLADVGPGSALSAGFRGLPVVSIDAPRTFGLTDAGKMIRMNGTTARTWTIPPVGSVAFPVGTVIYLRCYSTEAITVARGSGVALHAPGAFVDANRTIASGGSAVIIHEETNFWVISGTGVS